MTTEIELDVDVVCDRWNMPHRQNQPCLNPREQFPQHEAFEGRITGTAPTQPAPDTGEWYATPYGVWQGNVQLAQTDDEATAAQSVSDHNAVPRLAEALESARAEICRLTWSREKPNHGKNETLIVQIDEALALTTLRKGA